MNKTGPFKSALNYSESSWSILAGLRFFLACIVFAVHLRWFVPTSGLLSDLTLLGGRTSVAGFLLISGVSIAHSLSVQPDGYFRRRFLRIYPLYFAALCFTALLTLAIGSRYSTPQTLWVGAHWKTTIANLFFLQGLVTIAMPYDFPVWTIAVEVFFYALAPLLRRARPMAVICIICVSMVAFDFSHELWLCGYAALRYTWPWLTGFIFAMWGRPRTVAVLGLLGVFVITFNRVDTGELLSGLNYAAVTLAVLFAGRMVVPSFIQRILNFLGEQSYPLYLFHIPLCLGIYRYTPVRNPWMLIGVVLGAVIAIDRIFDHWLKEIFWKPLADRATECFSKYFPQRVQTLPGLFQFNETLGINTVPVLDCNRTENLGVDGRENR